MNTQEIHIEIAGQSLARVKYGSEAEDWGADRGPCRDGGIVKGELYIWSCVEALKFGKRFHPERFKPFLS